MKVSKNNNEDKLDLIIYKVTNIETRIDDMQNQINNINTKVDNGFK